TLLTLVLARDRMAADLLQITPEQRDALEDFCDRLLTAPAEGANQARKATVITQKHMEDILDSFATLLPPGLAETVKTKRRLIISPHRLLHAVPFHALPWDRDHRFLIQRFAITYVPNATCLSARHSPPARHRLLALGIRDYQVPGRELEELEPAEE